ncbi:hypothetical protein YC2023_039478 [Brassica napus]
MEQWDPTNPAAPVTRTERPCCRFAVEDCLTRFSQAEEEEEEEKIPVDKKLRRWRWCDAAARLSESGW